MFKIRPYEKKDYAQIASWGKARELTFPPERQLPKTGFIIPGIAAGFLYRTDAAVGIVGAFIANPEASKSDRKSAIEQILQVILAFAKAVGCEIVRCDTRIESCRDHARNAGFVELGEFTVFERGLGA